MEKIAKSNSYDILLAHPNDATREFLEAKWVSGGLARVIGVGSGRDAVARLRRGQFHALMTALDLGDTDAWRLTRMVRSGRFCPSTLPVLAIVDQGRNRPIEALAKEHGVTLVTPDAFDDLYQAVKRCVATQSRFKVLVIEDDAKSAKTVELALCKTYDVEAQSDGKLGLEAWLARRHDIVFLDVMLPRMSGPEVLQEILAIDPTQPVVIITAYATADRHQDLMLAGAAEFIEKPFNVHALQQVCETALRRTDLVQTVSEVRRTENVMREMANRVRVADFNLARGQANAAAFQLKNALAVAGSNNLSEDDWVQLLSEFREV